MLKMNGKEGYEMVGDATTLWSEWSFLGFKLFAETVKNEGLKKAKSRLKLANDAIKIIYKRNSNDRDGD